MSAPAIQDFRRRLLDGLATSIAERGYRETTVADVVRCAKTSKRTFYDHFTSKEQCFAELLTANNEELVETLVGAVDPEAPWRDQVRQAVVAYVASMEAKPAITLSWIRELPALGEGARPMLRASLSRLANVLVALSDNPGFHRDGVPPMSAATAVILLGGLRELTAQTVEDGDAITGIVEPAITAATALVSAARTGESLSSAEHLRAE